MVRIFDRERRCIGPLVKKKALQFTNDALSWNIIQTEIIRLEKHTCCRHIIGREVVCGIGEHYNIYIAHTPINNIVA